MLNYLPCSYPSHPHPAQTRAHTHLRLLSLPLLSPSPVYVTDDHHHNRSCRRHRCCHCLVCCCCCFVRFFVCCLARFLTNFFFFLASDSSGDGCDLVFSFHRRSDPRSRSRRQRYSISVYSISPRPNAIEDGHGELLPLLTG